MTTGKALSRMFSGLSRATAFSALLALLTVPAPAQEQTVERKFKGLTGQDIRIGVFANIGADCKAGPLPTIRLKSPPTNGNVTVKQGKVRTTNLRQCLAAEVPAFVVIYKSKPEFSGSDSVILEVENAGGKTQVQNITVTVGTRPSGQNI